ncbi:cytochrome P450 [Favolaschia claudopus]|uniref:Cytochrome P450 n=1 Tax=Favolaschia claudopus TaxID=2862362 RepID=A0AAW0D0Q1_9AGAR
MSQILLRTSNLGVAQAGAIVFSAYLCYALFRTLQRRRSTPLKGPPRRILRNWIFGMKSVLSGAPDPGAVFEDWATQYGAVYSMPTSLGGNTIVVTDTKSIAHFAAKETYGYVMTPQSRDFLGRMFGKGLFWAEGDSHKRQRRALNPAFSVTAIKDLTPIFFDSAYKVKAAWDAIIERRPDGTTIEVQSWMNHVSLDTIGLAGFSHDFGTLSGEKSVVADVFDNIGSRSSIIGDFVFLLSLFMPVFGRIPIGRALMVRQLTQTLNGLGDKFLETIDTTSKDGGVDKSVIGILVKSATSDKISNDEVRAQINVLLLAGYETTAISLTWALIELSRHPELQTKLRNELFESGGDLTSEELTKQGSLLDAFTCEILRLHPPLGILERMAAEDDILPLSTPMETADGRLVDSLVVAKGTIITIPIHSINRSEAFWGPDAKTFNPLRWLSQPDKIEFEYTNTQYRAQEIQGYRHLLTFSDGARNCLGKVFAVMEFKVVLSILVREYLFEFPGGEGTKIGRHENIFPRPKVEGEVGFDVPLRVRPFV